MGLLDTLKNMLGMGASTADDAGAGAADAASDVTEAAGRGLKPRLADAVAQVRPVAPGLRAGWGLKR